MQPDFSQVRLVVCDMDGTLLNSNHEVSDRFFELFGALDQKNIRFVAASGRQYDSMRDKLAPIQDDVLFIAENGALTKFRDRTLHLRPLPKEDVHKVLGTVKARSDIHPVLCCSTTAYVTGESNDFTELLREYYTTVQVVDDLGSVDDEVLKVAIYHFESSEEYIYPLVRHFEDTLKVKVSGAHWVDVSHTDAHKGYALKQVMDQYGIGPHELMVFGDFNNDIEMLQLADFSFAMANAHPNVKAVAKYQTTSNDDFGVERVLKNLIAR